MLIFLTSKSLDVPNKQTNKHTNEQTDRLAYVHKYASFIYIYIVEPLARRMHFYLRCPRKDHPATLSAHRRRRCHIARTLKIISSVKIDFQLLLFEFGIFEQCICMYICLYIYMTTRTCCQPGERLQCAALIRAVPRVRARCDSSTRRARKGK